ncbi:hypothetical protein FACS189491_02400 [Spirochaetia bacterium]|nr:hypothetical protein FACS189491_02400 [Spirochaetia bacterium]
MRNGIVIATLSGNVARIMQGLLCNEQNYGYAAADEFNWTGNEGDLWRMIKLSSPRLVFLESCFDREDTRWLVHRLCERYRNIHIAIFTVGLCEPMTAAALVTWGAESYLDLRGEEKDFRHEVRVILGGGKFIPAFIVGLTAEMKYSPGKGKPFTRQQLKIFKLTVFGTKKKEIGKLLCLSVNTIKTHRQHINLICGGEKVIDYIQFGLQRGIITAEQLSEGGSNYDTTN